MPSAALWGTSTPAGAGARRRFTSNHSSGTTTATPNSSATARSRLPHPASVSLPCPFAPHAGHVASTHVQLRASHCRRDSCRVDSEPLVPPSRHQPSTSLLLGWTRSLFGGIVYPGGRCITPSTPTSLYWCHSNIMLCITRGSAVLNFSSLRQAPAPGSPWPVLPFDARARLHGGVYLGALGGGR